MGELDELSALSMNDPSVKPAWTGGQYSIWRLYFGLYLCVHFALLVPRASELFSDTSRIEGSMGHGFPYLNELRDVPLLLSSLMAFASCTGLALALGWHDWLAVVLLPFLAAYMYTYASEIGHSSYALIGCLLYAHMLVAGAPYGSMTARGRVDPAGGWAMPRPVWIGAWIVMAASYSITGLYKLGSSSWVDGSALVCALESPLTRHSFLRETLLALPLPLLRAATWSSLAALILFAPTALIRKARPWIWAVMVVLIVVLASVFKVADLSLALLALHGFTFDPNWLSPRGSGTDELFYDGECGVCHRFVRFILSEDRSGRAFVFAPLQSASFADAIAPGVRAGLPDSIVVRTADGELLVRSSAVIRVLERCGGLWLALAVLARRIPTAWRDRAYDLFARWRHLVFARPKDFCPLIPSELASRFKR